jgi:thymidylate synthase
MKPYLELLRHVFENGEEKHSRGVLKSGERPRTRSIFGYQNRYDLRAGFPLVTTRRMPFRQVVVELLWFLRGSTSVRFLHEHGVTIWDEWADPTTGELGPIYGKQWRDWEGAGGRHVDQVAELLRGIEAVKADPTAPAARRLILSSWNPADLGQVKGPSGCHTLCQFSVSGPGAPELSCHLYQRSADLFLGVPWNIACYALLTHLVAKVTGLEVHEFIHSFGDAHIYANHFEVVAQQLEREPFPLPRLELDPGITRLDELLPDQFTLHGYRCHPPLRGEVAV